MSNSTPAKRIQAFFTGKDAEGPTVSLWITDNPKPGAPTFDGKVGEQRVGVYIRNGSKGPFLALVGDKGEDGKYPQLGTANMIVNNKGTPRLAIKMVGQEQTIWVSVSKDAPQDLLVKCGLNLELLEQKKAAAAGSK